MPASNIVHGSIFAAGLAVGVGAASLLNKNNTPTSPISSSPPIRAQVVADEKSTGLVAQGGKPGFTPSRDMAGSLALAPPSSPSSQLASDVFRYGFPGPIPDVLKRTAYVAAYDRRLRHPSWTAEHLTPTSLNRQPAPPTDGNGGRSSSNILQENPKKGDRSKSTFMEDAEVPAMFRGLLKDYYNSGYDRGHMVPAADAKISQQAMDETFFLTNIAPQVGDGFNRHYWAYLEDWCRRLVRPRDEGMKGTGGFEDVYVFTVPLYLPAQGPDGKWRVSYEVIGNPPAISVPTHFAKVVLAARGSPGGFAPGPSSGLPVSGPMGKDVAIGAFVLPNSVIPDNTPLTEFSVPVEAVERAAGLTLFSPQIKSTAKELCRETRCQVIVRRFDDANKKQQQQRGKGGQQGIARS